MIHALLHSFHYNHILKETPNERMSEQLRFFTNAENYTTYYIPVQMAKSSLPFARNDESLRDTTQNPTPNGRAAAPRPQSNPHPTVERDDPIAPRFVIRQY